MTMKKYLALAALASAMISGSAFAQEAAPVPPPPNGNMEQKPYDPLPPKFTGPSSLSHFQCYRAGGPIASKPVSLVTVDQFGKQDIVIAQPVMVCNPTLKLHNGQKFPPVNKEAHLVCYNIIKQAPNKGKMVRTQNQFGWQSLQTGLRTFFCAPSYKKLVGEKEFEF